LDNPAVLSLIAQSFSAVGECSAALVAAIALIFAFFTIQSMREQNQIAAEAAGLSRIICQISFSGNQPPSGKSLIPLNVEALRQREQLRQLSDVLKRWKDVTTAQLLQHRYLIITFKSDGTNTGTVLPRSVNAKIKLRIPPRPGVNFIARRDAFTIPISIETFRQDEIYFIPIKNVLACSIVIKGKYQFASKSYTIKVVNDEFNDYDLALGGTSESGGENATSA
jgi:hypothetical protein